MRASQHVLKVVALSLLYLVNFIKHFMIKSRRKYYQRIMFSFIFLLSSINVSSYANDENFVVKTVDLSGNEFYLGSITWWEVKNPDNKNDIQCPTSGCSEWIFPKGQHGLIFISAATTKKSSNDALCWNYYGGSISVDIDDSEFPEEIVLPLRVERRACR